MRFRLFVGVLLLAGCAAEDEIAFTSAEGSAAGMSICLCNYDDGSHGDFYLQVTCTSGNPVVGALSVFLDPGAPGKSQPVSLIFQPEKVAGSFGAAGTGQFAKLGPARRVKPNAPKIVHDIDGVELTWDAQDSCDVAYGCGDQFHLPAGALKGGRGGCQDFWATVDQY